MVIPGGPWITVLAAGILGLVGCDFGATTETPPRPKSSIQLVRNPALPDAKWNATKSIRVRLLRDSASLLDTILPFGEGRASLPSMPQETGFLVEASGLDSTWGLLWMASLAVPRSAGSGRFLLEAQSPPRRATLAPTPALTLLPVSTPGSVGIVLSIPLPGIPIHYSLDGSNPTANSPVWTDTIEAKTPLRIRAIALSDTLQPSWVLDSTVKAAP